MLTMLPIVLLLWMRLAVIDGAPATMAGNSECELELYKRFDCYPESGATKEKCESRGCCWETPFGAKTNTSSVEMGVPYCFYGRDGGAGRIGYSVCGHHTTDEGFILDLCLNGQGGPYGGNLKKIHACFMFETENRLHVKIHDMEGDRYEVPLPPPKKTAKPKSTNYKVSFTNDTFGFAVTRVSNGRVLFNTSVGGFIFSDQFLQISSLLPSFYVYGLGEHVLPLKLNPFWKTLTLFSRDVATPQGGVNLYGVHPFFLSMEGPQKHRDGQANGVLLLNSNAMDIVLQPTPAITYRTIGGVLDFYIFMGPYPSDVIQQYTEVIGRPTMPPYWSLGFHLCRWGYNSVDNMEKVRSAMVAHSIPQDVQWNDIDYMYEKLDFTIDEKNFGKLPQFVDQLHEQGLRYVLIMDPAIASRQNFSYDPYHTGVYQNVFIRKADGSLLEGKVWPGVTAFPDFFHTNTSGWWLEHIYHFHQRIKFDGLWIDMNEPSNFVKGSISGCPESKYETPPYTPSVLGGVLAGTTLCMTATQTVFDRKTAHYNTHSLYGYSEAVQTMNALRKTRERRSLVISRSTFPGSGAHGGHWLGDNHATWTDLAASIPGILNFNMFGIPLVGADICGFKGDTDEELCSRWMQLGAFYPFMRNHNELNARAQDPTAFGELLINTSRAALTTRYTLLPYLYTLFYQARMHGVTVARPLFVEFPHDFFTYENDKQFMWGDSLLISPVLEKGATSVRAYVPYDATWYEYYEGSLVVADDYYTILPASYDRVNLFVRAGTIVPTQMPGLTTTQSRNNTFGLIVAMDTHGDASGTQYIDDGESFIEESLELSDSLNIAYSCSKRSITSVVLGTFRPENPILDSVRVFGTTAVTKTVSVNGKLHTAFTHDDKNNVLLITKMGAYITKNTTISWTV